MKHKRVDYDDVNPEFNGKIEQLKSDWKKLSGPQRTDRLHQVLGCGISKRALAKKLAMNEAVIRYHLKTYPFRQAELVAIATGKTSLTEIAMTARQEARTTSASARCKIGQVPPQPAIFPVRTMEDIAYVAITALRRFLAEVVQYPTTCELQLLEKVLDRVQRVEAYGTLPKLAQPDADPWTVVLESGSKEPCDFLFEIYVDRITSALFRLVPASDARAFVMRVLLNDCDPLQYPRSNRPAA